MSRTICLAALTVTLICNTWGSTLAAADAPAIPASIFAADAWQVIGIKGNSAAVGKHGDRSVVTSAGKQLLLASASELTIDTRLRFQFRCVDPTQRSAITLGLGLKNPTDTKERGAYVTVTPSAATVTWVAFDPNSTARQPETRGTYKPQFVVERSLAWPESLRANVEADMVASKPLAERILTLDVTLREHGYELALDGIPLTRVDAESLDPRGLARVTLSPHIELFQATIEKVSPLDPRWVYHPVSLQGILNARQIDGAVVDPRSIAKLSRFESASVPFELAEPNADGNDHVDVGTSWFRAGNLAGRYSGRGADAVSSRWGGALLKDPARLTVRLPMARYRALHLIAAADNDADEVPIVTAQFYRAQAGFPKSFASGVPAFSAKSNSSDAIAIKTSSGKPGRLYRVTIPIESTALAEFDDLDFIDVELTKQVKLYRASPDPMYYSEHAAGLPSSVHIYALTAERAAVGVAVQASAYAHVWTAPEKPRYTVTLTNRQGGARKVRVELTSHSLVGHQTASRSATVKLPTRGTVSTDFTLDPPTFGYHDAFVMVTDGEQQTVEQFSLAYLQNDTRERGDWDFDRGPLFGFWNWGGGHHTPSAAKQLLVMAKAGIESTPGSFEEYTARHGDEARKVMEQFKLFTLKFAGAGDHYVTAKFASDLKTLGLEKARENFVKTLTERQSKQGPNSRPLFLSFYPEPSIGPVTHGIFPHFIGEPEHKFSDYERERYELFLNGFVQGAKIVRQEFPQVKCLLPHGDPAFVIHFLRQNPEIAPLLDGVCVDIPCFERLPEQQFHQVSLHRLYMARKEMRDAGIKQPLLPMYEGPCVPSGPGALTDQEHADLTIRNSLMLLVYGVTIQNGGFPAFDTASYWGEQHYGFGVLNRVSLETPKPAYAALATLTRHLNRANFNKWVPTGSLNVFALQFKHYRTGKLVHVLWTLRGSRPVHIKLPDGAKLAAYDQMDNPLEVAEHAGQASFVIDQSPCYIEGLTNDAQISLGAADHSDAEPDELATRLANPGDGSWTISTQRESEYEASHKPYIYRYPSAMTVKQVEAPKEQGSQALAVHFPVPEKDRIFVPYYSVLKPSKPIEIVGKASHLGLWVRAAGDWGRVVYFLRDAKGEQWISIGTRGAWNCDDLHSWTSFNFDGWRYLRMELPANSPYDRFREAGNAWWGPYSSGDGNVDLPLALEKIVVERRTHVMYVDDPQPADRGDVLLGDLFAEYETPFDASSEAVRLSAIHMSVPKDVPGLGNPIAQLRDSGTGGAFKIERITLPNQEADGTQCYVHFAKIADAKHYDIWVAPYEDGRGALHLGKAWKEPGLLLRGLRPYQNFYLFATYTTADGKVSPPSPAFKINLEDFFGMK